MKDFASLWATFGMWFMIYFQIVHLLNLTVIYPMLLRHT